MSHFLSASPPNPPITHPAAAVDLVRRKPTCALVGRLRETTVEPNGSWRCGQPPLAERSQR